MPAPKTEAEGDILRLHEGGRSVLGISKDLGVARNTVYAVLERNNRKLRQQQTAIIVERMQRDSAHFARKVLNYINKQPKTPERDELVEALGLFEQRVVSDSSENGMVLEPG